MKVVEAGGLAVIIAAMKNHATHAGVQEQACRALGNLAANGKEKGGVESVYSEGGRERRECGEIRMCLREEGGGGE